MTTVKVKTKDERSRQTIRSWFRLAVVKETEDSVIVSGRHRVIELMLLELHFRKKRHPDLDYDVEFLEEKVES